MQKALENRDPQDVEMSKAASPAKHTMINKCVHNTLVRSDESLVAESRATMTSCEICGVMMRDDAGNGGEKRVDAACEPKKALLDTRADVIGGDNVVKVGEKAEKKGKGGGQLGK